MFSVRVPQMATRWDVCAVRRISQGFLEFMVELFSSLIRTELPKKRKVYLKFLFEQACNV